MALKSQPHERKIRQIQIRNNLEMNKITKQTMRNIKRNVD